MSKNRSNQKTLLLAILLISVIIAIGFIPSINHSDTTAETEALTNIYDSLKYEKSIHVLAMLLIGFGFLMVFLRKHGYSSVTATYLAVSLAIPLYMLIKTSTSPHFSATSIDSFILAEFAAASLLIAMGAPLGRLNMNQYLALALLFIPAYTLNEWAMLESGYFTGFIDTGGSIVIHAFGAYFGLGLVSNTIDRFKNQPEAEADKTSNQFSLLGSMLLWIFWPSFTSALVAPAEVPVTAINTVFALCGATLATYVFSSILRGKIGIEDIANAALAGGVAIGSVCNVTTPGYAMLIGIAAGAVSTIGYVMIAPRLEKLIKGTDTCGINNLHGMPGVLGGLFGAFAAGAPTLQVAAVIITVAGAFITGKITGTIIEQLGQKQVIYSDEQEFHLD